MKLIGVILNSDLTWKDKTDYITRRAYSKLWMIRRLKVLGASNKQLRDVYMKQVRSILEFAVPVWSGSITKEEDNRIERVQKSFCAIVLGKRYYDTSYKLALRKLNLNMLSERRLTITKSFAEKSSSHPKFQNWFKLSEMVGPNTRSEKFKYEHVKGYKDGLKKGPIAHMTNLINIKSDMP